MKKENHYLGKPWVEQLLSWKVQVGIILLAVWLPRKQVELDVGSGSPGMPPGLAAGSQGYGLLRWEGRRGRRQKTIHKSQVDVQATFLKTCSLKPFKELPYFDSAHFPTTVGVFMIFMSNWKIKKQNGKAKSNASLGQTSHLPCPSIALRGSYQAGILPS